MRHNRSHLPIDCGLQHHFIIRVRKLRPPTIVDFDWINERRQVRQEFRHEQRRETVFCPIQNLLILKKERLARCHAKLMLLGGLQYCPAGPTWRANPGN